MATLKTIATKTNVIEFLSQNPDEVKRKDSLELLQIYKKATKEDPLHYVGGMIGFGIYHYKSTRSSQEGDWPLAAFACRKTNLTIYGMKFLSDLPEIQKKLGKFKLSGGCLHINKLDDIDRKILSELIKESYTNTKAYFNKGK